MLPYLKRAGLLMGDLNVHHPARGGSYQSGNIATTPDVVACSARWRSKCHSRVLEDHGVRHLPLVAEIRLPCPVIRRTSVPRWRSAQANWELYKSRIRESVDLRLEGNCEELQRAFSQT